MGLGKTIQCIALFAHFYAKGVSGPFLVIAPLSTLPNWLSEVRRFTPDVYIALTNSLWNSNFILRFSKIGSGRDVPRYKGKQVET